MSTTKGPIHAEGGLASSDKVGRFFPGTFSYATGGLRQHTTRNVEACQTVSIAVVDGAAAGTFSLPSGAIVTRVLTETQVAIPGSPTNTNLRLGSAATGAQYVQDVDVKGAGGLDLTLLTAARLRAATATAWHFTVASSGGTAASQDGTVTLLVFYVMP